MAEKSFTQVAVKNNQVVGIIIGDLKDQKSSFKNYIYYPVIAWYVTCLLVSEEGRNALSKYGIDINTINNTMIDKLGVDFDAELSLFMVAPEGQELGVGSTLYKYILNKLQKEIYNCSASYGNNRSRCLCQPQCQRHNIRNFTYKR